MSSNSVPQMEPAPPSLVERLRCGLIPNAPTVKEAADRIEALETKLALDTNQLLKSTEAMRQSHQIIKDLQDRIKALEKTIWTMHSEAHEHIKRIDAL